MKLDLGLDSNKNSGGIENVFYWLAAIIFLIGFICGIVLAFVEVTTDTIYTRTETEFSFAIALTYWGVSFISGMIFIAIGKIINLLKKIEMNTRKD